MQPHGARLGRSRSITGWLHALTDDQLQAVLDGARPLAVGIGGSTSVVQVLGTPVFVKRVTLTDLERQPSTAGSTTDLHGLPLHFHYGVGSAGVGAWRELEAHRLVDRWVRTRDCEGFPLLHHWRVLDGPAARRSPEDPMQEVAATVHYWHGSAAVRQRLTALANAHAGLYLFLEHIPQTLGQWLAARLADGPDALDAVCDEVAEDLISTAAFMTDRGLQHFDAHLSNILTDGERLYFSDFGLALSSTWSTTEDEDRFLRQHHDHDIAYVVRELVNWLIEAFTDGTPRWADGKERNSLVRRYAEGQTPLPLPSRAAALVTRFAPVADVVNDFYFRLHAMSRHTDYPARDLRAACQAAGLTW